MMSVLENILYCKTYVVTLSYQKLKYKSCLGYNATTHLKIRCFWKTMPNSATHFGYNKNKLSTWKTSPSIVLNKFLFKTLSLISNRIVNVVFNYTQFVDVFIHYFYITLFLTWSKLFWFTVYVTSFWLHIFLGYKFHLIQTNTLGQISYMQP